MKRREFLRMLGLGALDSKGQIRDHGYWQDHLSLLAQIEEARNS